MLPQNRTFSVRHVDAEFLYQSREQEDCAGRRRRLDAAKAELRRLYKKKPVSRRS